MRLAEALDAFMNFQQSLDQLRSSNWLEPGTSGSGSYPPMNIFREGDDLVIITEIPGVRKEDLQIQVHENTLRIAGSKQVAYGDGVSMHRRERLAGRFDRSIALPIEIDAQQVRAEYRDGILALHLPRAERSKPRSISVN